MIRSVDLTDWVILEDLKSSLLEGTQVQCGFRCADMQFRRRIPASACRSEEAQVRTYSEGTQNRKRRPAWVRRGAEARVRTHSESTRRDSFEDCVPPAEVRGAIVYLGVYLH